MHPSNPLLELRFPMPVMSSSPPPGLAEHLQLLQTSCIGPKCAFLLPPTPHCRLASVLPGETMPIYRVYPDGPSATKTAIRSVLALLPPPFPAPTSSASSPAHNTLAALTIYSEASYGFPHTQPCRPHAPPPPRPSRPSAPLRPRPPPLSAVLNGALPAGPARS